ncbi:MAG: hypothetical protein ACYCO4_00285 [Sulfobacillus sp.]
MPISRLEMQSGSRGDSLSNRIVALLAKHKDEAYTSLEIAGLLSIIPASADSEIIEFAKVYLASASVRLALDRLVRDEVVISKSVEGPEGDVETYYAISAAESKL